MTTHVGLIGAGALGGFLIPHLAPHVALHVHDPHKNVEDLCAPYPTARAASFEDIAQCAIIVIAVPIKQITLVAQALAPFLKEGQLVMDVASVKVKPLAALLENIPDHVSIMGTHPLFGPQSGANGIQGMKIVLCEGRGGRVPDVKRFLEESLELETLVTTAEAHDRDMAYAQGLTHLVARGLLDLNIPALKMKTKSFAHLEGMMELVRSDSEELFFSLLEDNPFAEDIQKSFFRTIAQIQEKLAARTRN